MKRTQKVGMVVNGKATDLENYLLNIIERPLPKPPTHYVVAEVLNTDLSIKRVTIYFNPDDTWKSSVVGFGENNPKAVGCTIGNGLQFLNNDPNTLAYQYWIVEVKTNKVVHNGTSYKLTKCEI